MKRYIVTLLALMPVADALVAHSSAVVPAQQEQAELVKWAKQKKAEEQKDQQKRKDFFATALEQAKLACKDSHAISTVAACMVAKCFWIASVAYCEDTVDPTESRRLVLKLFENLGLVTLPFALAGAYDTFYDDEQARDIIPSDTVKTKHLALGIPWSSIGWGAMAGVSACGLLTAWLRRLGSLFDVADKLYTLNSGK